MFSSLFLRFFSLSPLVRTVVQIRSNAPYHIRRIADPNYIFQPGEEFSIVFNTQGSHMPRAKLPNRIRLNPIVFQIGSDSRICWPGCLFTPGYLEHIPVISKCWQLWNLPLLPWTLLYSVFFLVSVDCLLSLLINWCSL
jgi:hypothetical protein